MFHHGQIVPTSLQGYCSYTISVASSRKIIQYRPSQYALSNLTGTIKDVYGDLAPSVHEFGTLRISGQDYHLDATRSEAHPHISPSLDAGYIALHVYIMDKIPGTPFSVSQVHRPKLSAAELQRQQQLVSSLAGLLSKSWPGELSSSTSRSMDGKIGSVLLQKLEHLANSLPTPALRARAAEVVRSAGLLNLLPVVPNHGDLLPSNIMVDASTFQINGLVDWAEAELLPFGTCLYGLDHLLGFMKTHPDGQPAGFLYYEQAADLRRLFWKTLEDHIPNLADHRVSKAVQVARDAGVLLWYGFAFDDGKIDRVVEFDRDEEDLMYLNAFLERNAVRVRL